MAFGVTKVLFGYFTPYKLERIGKKKNGVEHYIWHLGTTGWSDHVDRMIHETHD